MLQFSSDFLEKFNSSALLPNPFDNHDRNFRLGQRNGSVGGDPILWRRLKTFIPWFTPNRHPTNIRAQSTKCKYMASKSPLLNGSTLGQRDVQANDKGREHFASSKFIHSPVHSFIVVPVRCHALCKAGQDRGVLIGPDWVSNSQSEPWPCPPGFNLYRSSSEGGGALCPTTQISVRDAWVVAKA